MISGGTISDVVPAPGVSLRSARKRAHRRIATALPNVYSAYKTRKLRYASGYQAPADPNVLLTVDPTCVERKTEQSCWYWQHEYAGEVWGGSWDRETHPLDSDAKFVALKRRFRDGAAWEETELYAALRAEGVPHETIVEHLEKYDRLYGSIRERYRTSFELPHAEFLEEICISIGRNGELYSCDSGLHRLAIAQTLDLNEVPIRVMLRHEQWQRTREQFHEHWSEGAPLPDQLREYEDHPDLADLRRSHVVGCRG